MSNQAFSRRAFLGGLAATAAAGWVYESSSLSARVLRGSINDAARSIVIPPRPDLSSWSDRSVDICWVGHATVLVNFFGVKILTDPALFSSVGLHTPAGTIGRKRLVAAALPADQLPPIDLVLLSHAHMDHMDFPSLRSLPKSAEVITAPKTADLLSDSGFRKVTEMRWGQKAELRTLQGAMTVRAVEVKHWGARWKTDGYRGYNGYLLSRNGQTILFGGDTAYTEAFQDLPGNIRAVIMPIGSYGSGSGNHCTPEEAVTMVDHCGADFIIPIHHSTFPIGKEPIPEPLERLQAAVKQERIAITQIGGTWSLPV